MPKTDNPELRPLIQTLAPFIYVVTEEQGRFLKWLKEEYESKRRHKFKVWRRSRGTMDLGEYVGMWENPSAQNARPLDSSNPNQALQEILAEATPMDRHYYIFLDGHTLLDGRDPMIARRIMDLAEQAHMNRECFKSFIFVSHRLEIPNEMERMFRVAHFDLPDAALLQTNLETILSSDHLVQRLSGKIDVPRVVRSMAGLTSYEAEQITLENLTLHKILTPDQVRGAKIDIIKKNPLLELIPPIVTFDDIGGMDRLKGYLEQRKGAWTSEGKNYGLPPFNGVLSVGLPGNGKSLICKALAKEYELPLIKFDPAKLFAGQVGASEANLRSALNTLERMAPCVAWIDEVEKGLAGMQSSTYSDSGTTARVIGTFLNWMQECDKDVILAATANDVQNLPPELLRRFDEIFFVGLPGPVERGEIFRIHIGKVGRNPDDYDLDRLAEMSDRRSGAEIEKAVSDALYMAYDDSKREMTTDDLLEAVRTKPPLVVTMAEQLQAIVDWVGKDNETGDGVRARFAHNIDPKVEMAAV